MFTRGSFSHVEMENGQEARVLGNGKRNDELSQFCKGEIQGSGMSHTSVSRLVSYIQPSFYLLFLSFPCSFLSKAGYLAEHQRHSQTCSMVSGHTNMVGDLSRKRGPEAPQDKDMVSGMR